MDRPRAEAAPRASPAARKYCSCMFEDLVTPMRIEKIKGREGGGAIAGVLMLRRHEKRQALEQETSYTRPPSSSRALVAFKGVRLMPQLR